MHWVCGIHKDMILVTVARSRPNFQFGTIWHVLGSDSGKSLKARLNLWLLSQSIKNKRMNKKWTCLQVQTLSVHQRLGLDPWKSVRHNVHSSYCFFALTQFTDRSYGATVIGSSHGFMVLIKGASDAPNDLLSIREEVFSGEETASIVRHMCVLQWQASFIAMS